MSLVDKYRPLKFRDVVGQEQPVRVIKNIIRLDKPQPLLLFGSIGSGKTTLVRLYAKALNCVAVEADFSPCGVCERCRAFDEGLKFRGGSKSDFVEIDTPLAPKGDRFKDQLESLLWPPLHDKWRIIFFDEVHVLGKVEFEGLLKALEDPPDRVSFCFATTEFDRVLPAARSRFLRLQVRPLPFETAMGLLQKVAAQEKIQTEPEALALLIGLVGGQARDLLQYLDLLSSMGVTRANVEALFGADSRESLLRYFKALAEGDLNAEVKELSLWTENSLEKLRLTQLFLLALYYNELHHMKAAVAPLMAAITQKERAPIIEKFKERTGLDEGRLAEFWRELMAFWPIVLPDSSAAAIGLHFARFHHFVNAAPSLERVFVPDQHAVVSSPESPQHISPNLLASRNRRRRPAASNPSYLDFNEVKTLINRVSWCSQAYGLPFNARLTVWHSAFGKNDPVSSAKSMQDFTNALGYRLKDWAPDVPVLRYTIQEHDEGRGYCARIIAHIPDAVGTRLKHWVESWRDEQRIHGFQGDPIELDLRTFGRSARSKPKEVHGHCVQWLCAGLDPKEMVWDEAVKRDEKLVDLLKIPKSFRRKAGNISHQNRRACSEPLRETHLGQFEQGGMQFLSAFDDQRWDWLFAGWEFSEYRDRQSTIAERQAEETRTRSLHANDRSACDNAIDQLRSSWPDRYERKRTWSTWWSASEF